MFFFFFVDISQKCCIFAALNLDSMGNNVFESAPLVRLVVCLMAGIVVGEHVVMPLPWWPVFGALVIMALLLWRYEHVQSVMIALCFVVLGALLMDRQKDMMRMEWPAQEVQYEAVVLSDPVEKPKTMAVDILLIGDGRKLKCYFYKDRRSRCLRIGDGLKICSRIHPAEMYGFTGRTFVSSWKWKKARVSLRGLSYMERMRLFSLRQRNRLLQRLADQGLGGEQYAVVAAMALGDKSALTKELRDVYSVTGASHVLALSGLHLGIIYTLLSVLIVGRRWQTVSQIVIILSIWAFAFLVGLPVSVVRSATMLSTYAVLSLGRRDKMSLNTLAFTAILMLMVHPLSLFDVGFQLSFSAVSSILLLVPLFGRAFSRRYLLEHRVVRWLWGMVAVSCAAQIGTAPLVAYYFGRFSVYFLLTNFLVIPAATLILYLSLAVMIWPSLTFLLMGTVGLLNASLTWVVSLPKASIEGLSPSILQVVMLYVIIAAVYMLLTRLHVAKPA